MSLVSTYVRAIDGHLYKNPIIEDEDNNWFLCFDDKEPPELVIRTGHYPPLLDCFRPTTQLVPCGYRVFGNNWKFADAHHQFGQLIKRIPIPQEHEGKLDEIFAEGVIYDLDETNREITIYDPQPET